MVAKGEYLAKIYIPPRLSPHYIPMNLLLERQIGYFSSQDCGQQFVIIHYLIIIGVGYFHLNLLHLLLIVIKSDFWDERLAFEASIYSILACFK